MIGTIVAAIGLFAATNIDDIVVLTVLFLASARGALPGWKVVAGQYLGFIALVAISSLAAAGLTIGRMGRAAGPGPTCDRCLRADSYAPTSRRR